MTQTREAWFAEHPAALDVLNAFISGRGERGQLGNGIAPFSLILREGFGYPFGPPDGGPDTNLAKWVRNRDGKPKEPKESLAGISFRREESELRDLVTNHKRFVVTCAQNNTEVDGEWLDTLESYCAENNAVLLVVPIRYKNPTSRRDPQDEGDERYWWHDRVQRYLLQDNVRVHPLVQIRGFDRPQATSPNPLGGMDTVTKGDSAVFGHPQFVFKTVPTQHHRLPKLLYTSGAVTVENYSSTPLGVRADFHHTLGAVVIELREDGEHPHMRELKWSVRDKNLIDLDRVYHPAGAVRAAPRVKALITGDEHVRFHSPEVRQATYDGDDAIVRALQPEVIVRHDVFDCHSVTYHHRGKHLTQALMAMRGTDDLRDELEEAVRFIEATTPEDTENLIVFSNHNHMLTRFLQAGEQGVQPRNKKLYHELCFRMLDEARVVNGMDVMPDPFEIYFDIIGLVEATFLGPDDSRLIEGIEVAMHGHLGPNGARGSVRNLSRIGVRSVIGHVHSPEVYQGVYAAGTSSRLRLEYNDGPSGWMNTHVLIHANGERQMIHIIGGKWR